MARVVLSRALRRIAVEGTPDEIEVDARNVRELLQKLEGPIPGIGQRVEDGLAIAIDGDIVSDPLLEALGPDSEIHFLPALAGGS